MECAKFGDAPWMRMHCDIRILNLSVCSLEGLVELAEWRGRELNDFARSIRR